MTRYLLVSLPLAMLAFSQGSGSQFKISSDECFSVAKTVQEFCAKAPKSLLTEPYWDFVKSHYSSIERIYAGSSCKQLSKSVSEACTQYCKDNCLWNVGRKVDVEDSFYSVAAPRKVVEKPKEQDAALSDIDAIKEDSEDLSEEAE